MAILTRLPRESVGLHDLLERLCTCGCMAGAKLERLSWPWRARSATARPGRRGPRADVANITHVPRAGLGASTAPKIRAALRHTLNRSRLIWIRPKRADRPHAPASRRPPVRAGTASHINGPRHDARPRRRGRRPPPPRPRRCPRISRGQHPPCQPHVQPPSRHLRRPPPASPSKARTRSKAATTSALSAPPEAGPLRSRSREVPPLMVLRLDALSPAC